MPQGFAYMWNLQTKHMNKHNKSEEDSQIQRINKWLTEGRGWGGREIGEGD